MQPRGIVLHQGLLLAEYLRGRGELPAWLPLSSLKGYACGLITSLFTTPRNPPDLNAGQPGSVQDHILNDDHLALVSMLASYLKHLVIQTIAEISMKEA
jgi:hypothetical protein